MSPFKMIPYVEFDGVRSFPDSFIRVLHERCEFEGHAEKLFYEGTVRNADQFVSALKNSVSWVVFQDEVAVAVIWLNRDEGHFARFHFIVFEACSRRHLVKLGSYVLGTILNMKDRREEYLYDMLLGYIPSRNKVAVKYVQKCGGRLCGVIPNGAWIERENISEDVALVAVTRGMLA